MRTFACQNCGQLVFFENTTCLHCGAALGFEWGERELLTLRDATEGQALDRLEGESGSYFRCANAGIAGCNWLVAEPGELCASCRLTRTRPADDDPGGMAELARAEAAKRWLLFELGELGLPVDDYRDRDGGLAFDLLSSAGGPVTTGHANGVITLDLAESDDARREARRQQLREPYRTVLGHLRHEIGHYYWPILVADEPTSERARGLFGDERADYAQALDRHYENGPPPDWPSRFVSAYAAMHPAEDWAETFSHYLHIRDTLQTAAAYRLRVLGPEAVAGLPGRDLSSAPRDGRQSFEDLLGEWLPLTYALNALTRSMGRHDLYPFVLPAPVVGKLEFIHELVDGSPWRASQRSAG
jgi:hypothetical protein